MRGDQQAPARLIGELWLRVERAVKRWAQVRKLNGRNSSLVQMLQLALWLRHGCRGSNDLRSSTVPRRVASNDVLERARQVFEDCIQSRFKQAGERTEGLVKQVRLVLNQQTRKWVMKQFRPTCVGRVKPLALMGLRSFPQFLATRYDEAPGAPLPPRCHPEHSVDSSDGSRLVTYQSQLIDCPEED